MIRPSTLQELKGSIIENISAIQPEILENAVYNLEERLVILHNTEIIGLRSIVEHYINLVSYVVY